jgi:hypothetical protein
MADMSFEEFMNMSSAETCEQLWCNTYQGSTLVGGFEAGPCDILNYTKNEDSLISVTIDLTIKTDLPTVSVDPLYDVPLAIQTKMGYHNETKNDETIMNNIPNGPGKKVLTAAATLFQLFADTGSSTLLRNGRHLSSRCGIYQKTSPYKILQSYSKAI